MGLCVHKPRTCGIWTLRMVQPEEVMRRELVSELAFKLGAHISPQRGPARQQKLLPNGDVFRASRAGIPTSEGPESELLKNQGLTTIYIYIHIKILWFWALVP